MKNAWEILGIQPTENKRIIKKAYAAKLVKYHPEEYPEEFKEIQNAYQSITNSLSRNYTEELPHVNFNDSFKRKTAIYDIEEIKKVVKEPPLVDKKESSSLYEELDLDWSFRNIDANNKHKEPIIEKEAHYLDVPEQKEEKTRESIEIVIDPVETKNADIFEKTKKDQSILQKMNIEEKTLDLNELYYEKFKERLQYSKSIYNIQESILNNTFYNQMENIEFYHKISMLLVENIATFDALVLSFLYDAFLTICKDYGYPMDEYHLPTIIKKHRQQVIKNARIRKFVSGFAPIIIVIGIGFLCILSLGNKKQEEEKQQQVIQDINQTFEIEKDEQKKEDEKLILAEVQTQYPTITNCKILFNNYRKETRPSSLTVICSTNVVEETAMATAYFDADGNLSSVVINSKEKLQ